MTDEQRAALQVVWEILNGVLYDLDELALDAAEEALKEAVNRLEQLGVGQ